MSALSITLLALGVTIGLAASTSNPAISGQERAQRGALKASEGIYVDPKNFNIINGAAETDPTSEIAKLLSQAQEVKAGAIILAAGGCRYSYTDWRRKAFCCAGTP
jgi:hypothetical protein